MAMLSACVCAASLCFRGGSYNALECLAEDVNGAVDAIGVVPA